MNHACPTAGKPWLEQLFGISTKNVGGSSGLLLVMRIFLENFLKSKRSVEIDDKMINEGRYILAGAQPSRKSEVIIENTR